MELGDTMLSEKTYVPNKVLYIVPYMYKLKKPSWKQTSTYEVLEVEKGEWIWSMHIVFIIWNIVITLYKINICK